jgi:hypothetical protein
MKKLLITTALFFTALPFTFDGGTPAISKAHAVIGRPFTPLSFAGVHRRAVRRTFGVGANLGYRGYGYHPVARAALGYGYHHPVARAALGYGYHPVARAAVAGAALSGAAAYGASYYGAGYGDGAPLYDYAGGYGADYADGYGAPVNAYAGVAPGWGGGWGGWGWNRPFFGAALGWGGGWGGWGWRRWW